MPGICALVTPISSAEPALRQMVGRMTPFHWFSTFTHVNHQNGIGIGWVGFKDAEASSVYQQDGVVVVIDGEIYEVPSERRRLVEKGVTFTSQSAAEVLW